MANTSLPNLTERTATANSDLIHVNSGGTDYKETKANFLSDVNSSITSLNNSLAQCLHYFGNTNNIDLNDLTSLSDMGIYALGGNITNCPSGGTWQALICVFGHGGMHQMIFGANGVFARSRTGSPLAWTAWKQATMTIVN